MNKTKIERQEDTTIKDTKTERQFLGYRKCKNNGCGICVALHVFQALGYRKCKNNWCSNCGSN